MPLSVSSLFALGISILVAVSPVGAGMPNNSPRTAGDPAAAPPGDGVTIVTLNPLEPPARFGLERLKSVLNERDLPFCEAGSLEQAANQDILMLGTLPDSPYIQSLISAGKLEMAGSRESLALLRWGEQGRRLALAAGADDVGLMYALLEIAERVRTGPTPEDWFVSLRETAESPRVPVRSMAVLLHNEDCEKDWYYSREYWDAYFTMLATHRWNAFNLVFSHQTPYLSPLYAFHVTVEEHPEVRARGLSETQRRRNLETLQYISSLAKSRGISFTLGIWQQIAWESKHQGSRQESMVTGLTRDNMHSYTYLALLKLLQACPDIDTVQLRINHESGIDYDEQTDFFKDSVFKAIKDCGRPILLENRNVGLLRETIQASLDMGIPTRVSHKYWGEHMVFPYHPTRIMWTYSYGDWLRHPQTYRNLYQVWSLGSHRLLLWGDPGYVRRFAPTTTFQNADGFELCAPLSQKGFGNAPGAWRIFEDPAREYFRWEYERYWSTYLLFGRLSYHPETGDEVWMREIRSRFGEKAAPAVARAYRSASGVLPLIMGQAVSDYNQGVWAEKDMGGLINFYLHLFSFDPLRISSFMEHTGRRLRGEFSAKKTPEDTALCLERLAEECLAALAEAGSQVPEAHKEFWATQKDFQILSGLARYFAQKMRAATKLGLYYRTNDLGMLRQAIGHAERGLAIWEELSRAADEIYTDKLVLGTRSNGHWKDNLVFVRDDLDQLRHQEELFALLGDFDHGFDFGPKAFTSVTSIFTPWYTNFYTVEHRFQGVYPHSFFNPQLRFGWNSEVRLRSEQPRKVSNRVWQASNIANLDIPSHALLGDFVQGFDEPAVFRVDLPEGHYQAALVFTDRGPTPADHGPMSVSVIERFGERPILTDRVIKTGEVLVERFNFNMVGSRRSNFRLQLSAAPGADYILNGLTFTRIEPHIAHVPVLRALPGRELAIRATVTLPPQVLQPVKDSLSIARGTTSTLEPPDRIVRVSLCYSLDGGRSFESLEMDPQEGIYLGRIPAEEVREGEILYYLEAEDSIGQTVHFPEGDRNDVLPVRVSGDRTPPHVSHDAVGSWPPGKSLPLKIEADDPSGIDRILLYYRQTRQAQEYSVVTMRPSGKGMFSAVIPGDRITTEFDMMYYFEALDRQGNGIFFPDPDVEDPFFIVNVKR